MYDVLPSFVLGFHGCDQAIAESVFAGENRLRPSQNEYDWLGHGIYFWEQNPVRALEYAQSLMRHPHRNRQARINQAAVIGAVIDLGTCLNLLESQSLALVKSAFGQLKQTLHSAGRNCLAIGQSMRATIFCSVLWTVP